MACMRRPLSLCLPVFAWRMQWGQSKEGLVPVNAYRLPLCAAGCLVTLEF
jgi:hypothetical protein